MSPTLSSTELLAEVIVVTPTTRPSVECALVSAKKSSSDDPSPSNFILNVESECKRQLFSLPPASSSSSVSSTHPFSFNFEALREIPLSRFHAKSM